jgi:DNA modification methylase
MLEPLTLFEMSHKVVRHVADWFLSINDNQNEILRAISVLHNGGEPFECDPTYSTGNFYNNFQKPTLKFDLTPQLAEVKQADCRNLPLASGTVKSIIFDPPFVMSGDAGQDNPNGIISTRFTSFRNYTELKALYIPAISEFYRVLAPRGLFVIKCQDSVNSQKQYIVHADVIRWAQDAGFYCKDLFILIRKNLLMDSRWKNQRHARKAHSYFLVFIKA